MLSIKDMNTPTWEEFNNSVNCSCMNSVLFIRTKNPQYKCRAIYKNNERQFICGKIHLNLREIKFCNNVMRCIEKNNYNVLDIANSCNIDKCSFYPCNLKPIKVTMKDIVANIIKNDAIIVRKPIQNNIMLDSLDLETINPKLFSIWKNKYKQLTCEQINNMFLKKKEMWFTPHIIVSKNKTKKQESDYDDWRDDIIEMETKHERTNYADFWSYFENIILEEDERIIGNGKQVLIERPDIFEQYIETNWNGDQREFELGQVVTFSDWLLVSDHSNIFKYMLEHNVGFKEAKQMLKPVNHNRQELLQKKLMDKLLEQERKENQEIEARNILADKFLKMNFLSENKKVVDKKEIIRNEKQKSEIKLKELPDFVNLNSRYDFNMYVVREGSRKLDIVMGPFTMDSYLEQLVIKYKNKFNAMVYLLENNYLMISCTVKSIKDIKSYSFVLDKLPLFISELKKNNCMAKNPSTTIIPITNNNKHKELVLTETSNTIDYGFEFQQSDDIMENTDKQDIVSINGLDVAEYIMGILA
jgi:hypothetical protein